MTRPHLIVVSQPPGSNLCGPAVVATVARVELGAAIRAVGKRGLTRAADLRRGFEALGLHMGGCLRLRPASSTDGGWIAAGLDLVPAQPPDVVAYVCRVHWPTSTAKRHRSHWFAVDRRVVLDPDEAGGWPPGSRITAAYAVRQAGAA